LCCGRQTSWRHTSRGGGTAVDRRYDPGGGAHAGIAGCGARRQAADPSTPPHSPRNCPANAPQMPRNCPAFAARTPHFPATRGCPRVHPAEPGFEPRTIADGCVRPTCAFSLSATFVEPILRCNVRFCACLLADTRSQEISTGTNQMVAAGQLNSSSWVERCPGLIAFVSICKVTRFVHLFAVCAGLSMVEVTTCRGPSG
jgi:hypothetical protein